ncbi:hypothetical protein EWI61_10670 [Methylolobus aquaticus]|nr:hypothetical protein EWI61_10670 [Methylolobus aquaticus]
MELCRFGTNALASPAMSALDSRPAPGGTDMTDDDLARECFVIMPFGEKPFDDGSGNSELVDFDRIYEDIIKKAVEEDLKEGGEKLIVRCLRCDEIESAGLIHERMLQHILKADVAVVDITTQNPNVFYELGVRHTLRDRVTVLIRRAGTKIPFNIGGMNVIEYDVSDEAHKQRSRQGIASFIRNGLLSSNRDSLVYANIPGLEVTAGLGSLSDCDVYRYRLKTQPADKVKELWLVTGDLRHVNVNPYLEERPIDIWVSSENINMQMARVFEKSVSGLVRYLGSRRDETGDIVEDAIADELRDLMRGRQQVNPGTVVATGSGALLESHKVRRIYHAASVYGTIGGGYFPIANVEHCITAALALADRESERDRQRKGDAVPYTSILFPLLTTGTGSSNLMDPARKQLRAAIRYLQARAKVTALDRVCFLAPTKAYLDAYRLVLAELDIEPAEESVAAATQTPSSATKASARAAATQDSAKSKT